MTKPKKVKRYSTDLDYERLSEIVYSIIKNWSKNEKYSRYKLEDFDNWKDDLIDSIWRELKGITS